VAANGPGLLVIERILRDRQSIWQQVVEERDLNALTGRMLASSAIALACYGAVLGAFHSFLMALTSAIKLPLLFLITLAICLPTLYLFNLVFGARLSVRQALALVMVAITVTAMLAVAFAPISLFFLITAPDYAFFKLLNVAILTLSALVGLRFLTGGMHVLNAHGLLAPIPAVPAQAPAPIAAQAPAQAPVMVTAAPAPALVAAAPAEAGAGTDNGAAAVPAGAVNGEVTAAPVQAQAAAAPAQAQFAPAPGAPVHPMNHPGYVTLPPQMYQQTVGGFAMQGPPARRQPPVGPDGQRPASMTLLYVWILLFGFVGTQLAWTLRPFFGSPGEGFAFFRAIEGNFYAEILRTLGNLF
jgi:hypothetical protein